MSSSDLTQTYSNLGHGTNIALLTAAYNMRNQVMNYAYKHSGKTDLNGS
jgi:hypothetical protein